MRGIGGYQKKLNLLDGGLNPDAYCIFSFGGTDISGLSEGLPWALRPNSTIAIIPKRVMLLKEIRVLYIFLEREKT